MFSQQQQRQVLNILFTMCILFTTKIENVLFIQDILDFLYFNTVNDENDAVELASWLDSKSIKETTARIDADKVKKYHI